MDANGMPEHGDLRAQLRPFISRHPVTNETSTKWMIQAQEFHEGRWRPWAHFSGTTAPTIEEAREEAMSQLARWREWVANQERFDAMTEYVT